MEAHLPAQDKGRLRTLIRRRRSLRGAQGDGEAAAGLSRQAFALLDSCGMEGAANPRIGLFAPHGGEPPVERLTQDLLEAGHRVFLPVVLEAGTLDWAEIHGSAKDRTMSIGALHGIPEPSGARAGVDAALDFDVLFVPALAVDRQGTRLGQGGGYYDRLLPRLACPAVAVVHDDEILPHLPRDPWDSPVSGILTPTLWELFNPLP